MKLEVTVSAENKEIVKDFIDAMYGEQKTVSKHEVKQKAQEEDEPEQGAAPAPTKKAAPAPTKKAAPAPTKKAAPAKFADLDEDAQFEELKAIATRFQKKGHTKDIKAIIGIFEVTRITELDPSQYESVYDELVNYQNGMTVEEIVAQYE